MRGSERIGASDKRDRTVFEDVRAVGVLQLEECVLDHEDRGSGAFEVG